MGTDQEQKKVARRRFLKGAAVGVAGAAAGALSSCAAGPTPTPQVIEKVVEKPVEVVKEVQVKPWLPAKWDRECDVLVIGYGFGGACAAIAAKDAGGDVLIIEKSATAEGGNSGNSSGSIHTYLQADPDKWFQAIKTHSWGCEPDDEAIKAYVADALQTKKWLQDLGMELTDVPSPGGGARAGGTNGKMVWKNQRPAPDTAAAGMDVFAFEHGVVTKKGIPILFSTPATELIQDAATKEILGVKAKTGVTLTKWSKETPSCYKGGQDIYIKAKKAVILACGGYENNPAMQFDYNYPGLRLYPWGTPYNTGDGITMALAVNADLWHMHGLEWAAVNFKKATEQVEYSVGISATTAIPQGNHIFVNRLGKRFMNETKSMGHDIGHKPVTDFDADECEYPNIPFWVILDQNVLKAGPLCPELGRTGTRTTYYSATGKWKWSKDNSAELANGWIFKADTIEELAKATKGTDFYGKQFSIDPAGLAETVKKFNEYCANGADPEQGRTKDKMAPISTPPYYAVELGLTTINTQGGPRRNKNYQTMGTDGKPIPRLYSVGELGSINGYEYVCGNITEAHTTGRVAGQNAAKEKPWS